MLYRITYVHVAIVFICKCCSIQKQLQENKTFYVKHVDDFIFLIYVLHSGIYRSLYCLDIRSLDDRLTRGDYLRIVREIFSCNFTSVSTKLDLQLNTGLNNNCKLLMYYVWHVKRCNILKKKNISFYCL